MLVPLSDGFPIPPIHNAGIEAASIGPSGPARRFKRLDRTARLGYTYRTRAMPENVPDGGVFGLGISLKTD
jgi:hypothetical protein